MLLEVINALKETVQIQNETIESLSKNGTVQHVENPINKELEDKVRSLEQQNREMQEWFANHSVHNELKRTKEAYRSLFDFCFTNINPSTPFDPDQARQYWDNLIR